MIVWFTKTEETGINKFTLTEKAQITYYVLKRLNSYTIPYILNKTPRLIIQIYSVSRKRHTGFLLYSL